MLSGNRIFVNFALILQPGVSKLNESSADAESNKNSAFSAAPAEVQPLTIPSSEAQSVSSTASSPQSRNETASNGSLLGNSTVANAEEPPNATATDHETDPTTQSTSPSTTSEKPFIGETASENDSSASNSSIVQKAPMVAKSGNSTFDEASFFVSSTSEADSERTAEGGSLTSIQSNSTAHNKSAFESASTDAIRSNLTSENTSNFTIESGATAAKPALAPQLEASNLTKLNAMNSNGFLLSTVKNSSLNETNEVSPVVLNSTSAAENSSAVHPLAKREINSNLSGNSSFVEEPASTTSHSSSAIELTNKLAENSTALTVASSTASINGASALPANVSNNDHHENSTVAEPASTTSQSTSTGEIVDGMAQLAALNSGASALLGNTSSHDAHENSSVVREPATTAAQPSSTAEVVDDMAKDAFNFALADLLASSSGAAAQPAKINGNDSSKENTSVEPLPQQSSGGNLTRENFHPSVVIFKQRKAPVKPEDSVVFVGSATDAVPKVSNPSFAVNNTQAVLPQKDLDVALF